MREKLANTKAATDNDTSDDATGAARRKMAKESAERKKAELAERQRQNAAMQAHQEHEAATDDDVTDTGGRGAAEDGKGLEGAQGARAKEMAAQNAAYKDMIKNTGAATDNDVTDDDGRGAAQSGKGGGGAQGEGGGGSRGGEYGSHEDDQVPGAATDNDITDDPEGGRIAAAKASRENKPRRRRPSPRRTRRTSRRWPTSRMRASRRAAPPACGEVPPLPSLGRVRWRVEAGEQCTLRTGEWVKTPCIHRVACQVERVCADAARAL